MFVKIQYYDVERNETKGIVLKTFNREVVYDCQRVSIGPEKSPERRDGAEPEENIIMIMDVGGQDERNVQFVKDAINQEVEVFYMNSHGKTIEHYIY